MFLSLFFALLLIALIYWFLVRPWHLRWGATDEELARAMPLDNEVAHPTYVTNRAITIQARAEEIWPWLAQMGELPRGGFYSYVWIERLLGMQVENAERILPECQQLHVGQALDRTGNMLVKAAEPNQYLVLGPPPNVDPALGLVSTWALCLYPGNETYTRLVSRVRASFKNSVKSWFMLAVLDVGQCVMERKMLLEIKRRAERTSQHTVTEQQRLRIIEGHMAGR